MIEELEFDPQKTVQRVKELETYFQTQVLDRERFICQNYQQCLSSHPGTFHQGQLHHVGDYYDAYVRGRPYRIMIVGQEYGHGPANVSLNARSQMVLEETGLQKTFGQRNPHMRGVTSALNLLYDLPLSRDHESEFMQIDNKRLHIFDTFSLANYLLCSAVEEGQGRRGKATDTMLKNCRWHFRKAIEILEPTVMVVQSKGYWMRIKLTFDQVEPITNELYRVRLGNSEILVAVFAHPSTPDNLHNWGRSTDTPYLLNTVAPTIEKIKNTMLEMKPSSNTLSKSQLMTEATKNVAIVQKEKLMDTSNLDYDTFYTEMQARLCTLLPGNILARKPRYKVRGNRLQIFLDRDRITGSHYEICLHRSYHEIALHFESTSERNLARRQVFDPLLKQLSDTVDRHVQSGKLENRGYMRVWIKCPKQSLTESLLAEYTDVFARFIMATFPTLEMIYQQEKAEKG